MYILWESRSPVQPHITAERAAMTEAYARARTLNRSANFSFLGSPSATSPYAVHTHARSEEAMGPRVMEGSTRWFAHTCGVEGGGACMKRKRVW